MVRGEIITKTVSQLQDVQQQETSKANSTVRSTEGKGPIEFKSIALNGLFIIAFLKNTGKCNGIGIRH